MAGFPFLVFLLSTVLNLSVGQKPPQIKFSHRQPLVHRFFFSQMMLSDTLNAHLEEVDRTAAKLCDRLTSRLAEQEGITEQLKETNQMEWVQQMNNIRNRAEEVVRKKLICA